MLQNNRTYFKSLYNVWSLTLTAYDSKNYYQYLQAGITWAIGW